MMHLLPPFPPHPLAPLVKLIESRFKTSFINVALLKDVICWSFIVISIGFYCWPQLTVLVNVFPKGCPRFLDVDFSLITQIVRHSVKCQRLICPVILMRQLIRTLISSPSEWGKDFIGAKTQGQHGIHFSNQPAILSSSSFFYIQPNSSQRSFNMDYTAWSGQ